MTGPYFEIEAPRDLSGWTTLATLSTDRTVLAAKVATTRTALGEVPVRVAASIDFLGVAARILSPAVRSAVVDAKVPLLDPEAIWWRPAQPGPMRLAMDVASWRRTSAAALHADVVQPVMVALVEAYRTAFALSPKVLWGNVASALNGAAAALAAGDGLVRDVLALGELAGTARLPPPHFVRSSCCLYYRVPGGGICDDCVLLSRTTGSAQVSGRSR
jgi:hypothetical protein